MIENNYCSEEELREEIIKLQKVEELRELLKQNINQERVSQLQSEGITQDYKKTRFGEMVLQIVNRLATKHNFSGYSSSWKMDMVSNAVEKVMAYAVSNFDSTKISKSSGKPVKAFAYITQIANNAFVETIKILKKEQETIDELLRNQEEGYRKIENIYEEEPEVYPDVSIYFYKEIASKPFMLVGRGKDIELDKTYPCNTYFVVDKDFNILENHIFTGLYKLCEKYRDKYIKIVYPKDYEISDSEYRLIKALRMENLDISRYRDDYIASFPKKKTKEKVNPMDIWNY